MESTFIGKSVLCCALLCSVPAYASDEPLHPLQDPRTLKLDARKVQLGAALFSDTRLSKNDTISCASCHSLTQGGTDGRQFPIGINGQVNVVNAPTVYNVVNNNYQFWDGRAATLEAQLDDHVASPIVFASSWSEIGAKLGKDAAMGAAFRAAYPDGIQAANLRDALASYERSLLTPSRFDRYLMGDAKALSADELAGYKKFKDYGCVGCHQGVNVGGNMFQELGVMRDYFAQRGNPTPADLGRYNVTKLEADKHVFKVPSLRNVALTAPYFHDGTALTLNDAMNVMFKFQLGRRGTEADKQLIIKFLNTLSGEKLIAR